MARKKKIIYGYKINRIRVPDSLITSIEEDPDRFAKYLNLRKIQKAKNPHIAFKRELQRAFGTTKTGINMWKYLKGSYNLQNMIWTSKSLQKGLPQQFQGDYNKKNYQKLLTSFITKTKKPKDTGIYAVKKTVQTKKSYTRIFRGKKITVKQYSRTKARKFTNNQTDFLLRRLGQSPKEVMIKFNKIFNTNRTKSSISTKLLRLKKR